MSAGPGGSTGFPQQSMSPGTVRTLKVTPSASGFQRVDLCQDPNIRPRGSYAQPVGGVCVCVCNTPQNIVPVPVTVQPVLSSGEEMGKK